MAKSFATAAAAFDHLLDIYEAQPDRSKSILAEPDYSGMDAAGEQRFHQAAQIAADSGAIRVEMRKRPDEHLIKSLRLVDPEKLYTYTGRARRISTAIASPSKFWPSTAEPPTNRTVSPRDSGKAASVTSRW